MSGRQYAVIDVETTGLSPASGRVVEIGLLLVNDAWDILDSYETLVNPEGPVGATWIHGITSDMVIDAPFFHEVLGDVISFLRGSVLVAHNIPFDRGFLLAELARAGVHVSGLPSVCTLSLARKLYPRVPSRSLGPLCAHLGTPLERAHTALGDCKAAFFLLQHFSRQVDISRHITHRHTSTLWPDMPLSGRSLSRFV